MPRYCFTDHREQQGTTAVDYINSIMFMQRISVEKPTKVIANKQTIFNICFSFLSFSESTTNTLLQPLHTERTAHTVKFIL